MNKFNLQQHLDETYTSAPSHAYRPIIGITTNHEGIDATLREVYYKQIVRAGGTPYSFRLWLTTTFCSPLSTPSTL